MPLVPVLESRPGDICHADVTVPVEASCKSCPACRDPARLLSVAALFEVVTNPRYAPRDTDGVPGADTFCNIFATDVAQAMCVILPRWWRGRELSANGLHSWLDTHGSGYGWARVDAHQARAFANVGAFVVGTWANVAGRSGHIAVILPSPDPGPLLCAQAGKHNRFAAPISDCFGSLSVTFWAHP